MGWDNQLTELNSILAELYPRKDQSYRIVDMANIPSAGIPFKDAARDNWYYILKEANRSNKINNLIQVAVTEFPEQPKLQNLRDLYQKANDQKVMQTADNYQLSQLKSLVKESRTEEVIDQLEEIAKNISPDFHNSVILQSARLRGVLRERRQGTIYDQDYRIQMARINNAILSLIDDIPQEVQLKAMLSSLNAEAHSPEKLNIVVPDTAVLEKVIGREELFEINWVQKALQASKSICKVELSNGESGTGFLLKNNYLLTNNHVLPTPEKAGKARIIFNYQIDAAGDVQPTSEYRLDTAAFKTSSEVDLDYTLVKVIENGNKPLSDWGHLELDDFSDPQVGDKVNIIQHPEGKSMKIALPDEIISVWNQYLFYLADTKNGSSGSPVFNQKWKVVALHHAGKNEKDAEKGLQINEAGEIRPSNRGILIKSILKNLSQQGVNL